MLKNLFIGTVAKNILAAAVLAGSFAAFTASPALADRGGKWDRDDDRRDDHDHDRDHDRDDHHRKEHSDVKLEFGLFGRSDVVEEREETHINRVYIEPVYRTVCDKVWVEPVYKTVCEKVFVPPVTKTVCERILVPDRYEEREVIGIDLRGRKCSIRQRVLVERAHYERVEREVEIAPGHYDSIERRVLVSDGHFDKVERQELVSAGHWEVQRERVIVEERPRHEHDDFRVRLDFGK